MALIKLSGTVSGVKETEDQAGYKHLSFRIGGRPVNSYLKMNVMDNDQVTAVGTDEPEPRIDALRNDITKVEYWVLAPKPSWSIVGMIIGVVTIPILIGLPILFMMWLGYHNTMNNYKHLLELQRIMKGA